MAEGQFTGKRCAYKYTSDSSIVYLISYNSLLGDLSGNGLTRATTGENIPRKPKRLYPRVAYWLATVDERMIHKQLIIGTKTAAYYDSTVVQMLTIGGITGKITGTRGERIRKPCY